MRPMRVLIFDLETGGVNAFKSSLGMILNFGYKWLDEKETHVLTVDQFPNWFVPTRSRPVSDKLLLQKALKIMEEADLIVAHYGERFDRRFFQGRCVINNLLPPPPTKLRDTWQIARRAFNFQSNRLGALAQILQLKEKKHQKTASEWPGWWLRAMAGDTTAIHDMAKYCAQDVRTTERLYLRIRMYDNSHPRLFTQYDQDHRPLCGVCGGLTKYKGYSHVGVYRYRRFRCKNKTCGKWDRERHRT